MSISSRLLFLVSGIRLHCIAVNRRVLQTSNSDTYREKVPIAPMLTVANMMKSFHPKLVFICRVTFETTKSGIQYQERTVKTCSSTYSTTIERRSPLRDHSVLFVWGIYQQHRPKATDLEEQLDISSNKERRSTYPIPLNRRGHKCKAWQPLPEREEVGREVVDHPQQVGVGVS